MAKHDYLKELERLAARVADEEPITSGEEPAGAHVAAFIELQNVVHGFRKAQVEGPTRPLRGEPLFRFGQLEAIEKLGEGAQAQVYRVYDPVLDKFFALKIRRPEIGTLSHAFLEEARHLASIHHPNVLRVYGAAVIDGRAGIWTEWVRGRVLEDLIADNAELPEEDATNIGRKLCAALAALHAEGIVHGDLKPSNVMIDDSGRVVLMDFGAAQRFRNSGLSLVTLGTLQFLAPEVMRGGSPSPQSDLYSLGVLLFRLLSGCFPYAANDFDSLMMQQDSVARLKLSKLKPALPARLRRAVERCIEIEPARRHGGAVSLEAALQTSAPRATATKLVAAIVAVTALLAAAVGYISWSSSKGASADDMQVSLVRESTHSGREILHSGSLLKVGDQLAVEFNSRLPIHLYIFDSEGASKLSVLYPIAGVLPGNPLSAGVTHHIPGSVNGERVDWQVSGTASEEVVVVAATEAQPSLDRTIASLEGTGVQASALAQQKRGMSQLVAAPEVLNVGDPYLREVLGQINRIKTSGKVRVWDFRLPHGA